MCIQREFNSCVNIDEPELWQSRPRSLAWSGRGPFSSLQGQLSVGPARSWSLSDRCEFLLALSQLLSEVLETCIKSLTSRVVCDSYRYHHSVIYPMCFWKMFHNLITRKRATDDAFPFFQHLQVHEWKACDDLRTDPELLVQKSRETLTYVIYTIVIVRWSFLSDFKSDTQRNMDQI